MSVVIKKIFIPNNFGFKEVFFLSILSIFIFLLVYSIFILSIENHYHINFISDSSLSNQIDNLLKNKIAVLPKKHLTAQSILASLLSEYKYIKSCTVLYKSDGSLDVNISLFAPVARIAFIDSEKVQVLCSNGSLADYHVFKHSDQLPLIEVVNHDLSNTLIEAQINDQYKLMVEFIKLVKNINQDLLYKYTMHWVNNHKVLFKSAKDSYQLILDGSCAYESFYKYKKFQDTLKNKINYAEKIYSERRYKNIDIRFKGQIVCSN